jgi:Fic family protein
MTLREFVKESNRIEGIAYTTSHDMQAHRTFLDLDAITVGDLEEFVRLTARAELRRHDGMNVGIYSAGKVVHQPPAGGARIEESLALLLDRIQQGDLDDRPYAAHVAYETLHPFMDGNGRSGRVLWAWQMIRAGRDPFALGFLHAWYYQSLDVGRARV